MAEQEENQHRRVEIVTDAAVGAAGAVYARRGTRIIIVVHPNLPPDERKALIAELLEE